MGNLIWVWCCYNCYFLTEKEAVNFAKENNIDEKKVHRVLMDEINFNNLSEFQGF